MDSFTGIVHLEPSDIDSNKKIRGISGNGLLVVYAPWCGHCKSLKADWQKLSSQYPNSFLAVNSTDTQSGGDRISQLLGAQGFPWIMTFTNGVVGEQYKSGRSANELLQGANLP
jgi:thiol-disulfide isomerase/thioredoxin